MGVVPMKHDDDFFGHNSKATEAAGKEYAADGSDHVRNHTHFDCGVQRGKSEKDD
jgi:hypothetical protein